MPKTKTKARPKTDRTGYLMVRLSEAEESWLDAIVEHRSAESGRRVSKAMIVRDSLRKSFQELEIKSA